MKNVKDIPLNKIKQRENSRVEYDEADISELMTSMRQTGLLQKIGLKDVGDGTYEVVWGNRRFVAAKKLGWETIPAEMTEANKDEDFFLKNATENMLRVDVSLGEQGRTFNKLLKLGLTASQISARLGVDKRKVQTALDVFMKVPPKFRDKIFTGAPVRGQKKGKISASTSQKIVAATTKLKIPKHQVEKLYELASQDNFPGDRIIEVSKLMGKGYTAREALTASEDYRVVQVCVTMSRKRIEYLEKYHGESIREVLHRTLERNKELKIIGRRASDVSIEPSKPKTILRKKAS